MNNKTSYFKLGYKGKVGLDAAAYYCPYVPINLEIENIANPKKSYE